MDREGDTFECNSNPKIDERDRVEPNDIKTMNVTDQQHGAEVIEYNRRGDVGGVVLMH